MAFGLALLAALVYGAGPRRLAEHIHALGWWAPVIFLPYAIASAFDAAGWRATFQHAPPGLARLYVVRLIGEAVNNVITKPVTSDLAKVKKLDHGNYLFEGKVPAMESGTYGLNVRVIPTHPHLIQAHELRLITWAK